MVQAHGILIRINKMSGMLSAKTLHEAIPTTFRESKLNSEIPFCYLEKLNVPGGFLTAGEISRNESPFR